VDELAAHARTAARDFNPSEVRAYTAREFSLDTMVLKYANYYRDILNQAADDNVAGVSSQPRAIA
jgi:hypothetical protein